MKDRDGDYAFVDTNILAYAFDESDPHRRKHCADLVRAGFQGEANYCVSNQILGELFIVLTRKVGKPLAREQASTLIDGFIDSPKWTKLTYTHATIKMTLNSLETINTSFWDMLIAETMREAGLRTIYTENKKDFERIPWLQIENPLKNSGRT